MSYILDALKRADAERERGHVPGLHTHNMPNSAAKPARRQPPARVWAVVALGAAVALAMGFWWLQPAPPDPAPSLPSGPAVNTGAAAPAAPAAPSPAPGPQPPAPASTTPPEAVLPLLSPAPRPTPPRAESDAAAPKPKPKPKPKPAPDAASRPAPAASVPDAVAVRRWADLSPDARAQLPALQISGSTYSQNPAHRMLIANGRVVQEGQEIAPGLVLETIGPRSAVLSHRGLRYSVGY